MQFYAHSSGFGICRLNTILTLINAIDGIIYSPEKVHVSTADILCLIYSIFRKGAGATHMKTFGTTGVQVKAHCKREIFQIPRMEKLIFSTAFSCADSAVLVGKIKHSSQK